MVYLAEEHLEYDINQASGGSMKSQDLSDFVKEFSSHVDEESPTKWALSVDGTLNMKWSGARIVLEGHGDIIIKQALKFKLKANNN